MGPAVEARGVTVEAAEPFAALTDGDLTLLRLGPFVFLLRKLGNAQRPMSAKEPWLFGYARCGALALVILAVARPHAQILSQSMSDNRRRGAHSRRGRAQSPGASGAVARLPRRGVRTPL